MDWLEQELKQALARKDPPPDFAARVLDAARAQSAARSRTVFYMRRWPAVAAAVIVIMGAGGGAAWRHHRGVVAKQQVMLALHITSVKLNHIQTHVREMNR